MAQVLNPTESSGVDHNVNNTRYVIPPGETAEVRDSDVEDLLKLLGFLVVVGEDGESAQEPVLDQYGDMTLQPTTVAAVKEKRAKDKKEHSCGVTVTVTGPNGRRSKQPCGFKTVSKRAMLAHTQNEHPKGAPGLDSPVATDTTRDEVNEDALGEAKPKRKKPTTGF